MALTIKNLGVGTLGTGSPNTTVVANVPNGKSVLVDNIIFFNRGGSSVTLNVFIVDNTLGSKVIVKDQSVPVNAKFVLEALTLSVGDGVAAYASGGSSIDFLASGVEKDL